jgi:hypothetical protein
MALKSPESVLRSALVSSQAVSALVGNRVYPVVAPANAALPYITWRRAAVQRSHSLAGPIGTPVVSLELELYASTYEGARDLADKCRLVLDGYGGSLNNVEVSNTTLDNEYDGFALLQGSELPIEYTVTQSYSVLWQES